MRIKALLVILLMVCAPAMASDNKTPRPPTQWKPIVGFSVQGARTFVDVNSLEKTKTNDSEYVKGDLLISIEQGQETEIDGKKVMSKALVKTLIVECNKGLVAVVRDLYFNVAIPKREDKPLGGLLYVSSASSVKPLEKTSLLYKTFCPVYL
jgi:hypothetical protein